MAVTYSNFIIKYPQFTTVAEARFNLFLVDVTAEVTEDRFGDKTDKATEMLLGHFLTLADPSRSASAAGPVSSRSVNVSGEYSISESYSASSSQSSSKYAGTWFGQEYQRILDGLDTGMSIIVGP